MCQIGIERCLRLSAISFIIADVTRQGCKPDSELDSRVCQMRLQRNRRKTVD
jgi:hypothetical protein